MAAAVVCGGALGNGDKNLPVVYLGESGDTGGFWRRCGVVRVGGCQHLSADVHKISSQVHKVI